MCNKEGRQSEETGALRDTGELCLDRETGRHLGSYSWAKRARRDLKWKDHRGHCQ